MDLPQPREIISRMDVTEDHSQAERTVNANISLPERASVAEINSQPESADVTADISKTGKVKGGVKTEDRKTKIVIKNSKPSKGKEKKQAQPATSEMVVKAMKCLKRRNGATEEAIRKYIEDNYDVNINMRSRHIRQFLVKGVEQGLIEKAGGDGVQERFKMKEESGRKMEQKKSLVKEQKMKKSIAVTEKKTKQ